MKTEQDYRVTYEVAKLMKQADYVGLVTACYYIDNGEVKYVEGIIGNGYNSYPNCYQAPLIPMALDWAESLGYKLKGRDVCFNGEIFETIYGVNMLPESIIEAYLEYVCNHIITNKTNNVTI